MSIPSSRNSKHRAGLSAAKGVVIATIASLASGATCSQSRPASSAVRGDHFPLTASPSTNPRRPTVIRGFSVFSYAPALFHACALSPPAVAAESSDLFPSIISFYQLFFYFSLPYHYLYHDLYQYLNTYLIMRILLLKTKVRKVPAF